MSPEPAGDRLRGKMGVELDGLSSASARASDVSDLLVETGGRARSDAEIWRCGGGGQR
jgi:hypothetical protein